MDRRVTYITKSEPVSYDRLLQPNTAHPRPRCPLLCSAGHPCAGDPCVGDAEGALVSPRPPTTPLNDGQCHGVARVFGDVPWQHFPQGFLTPNATQTAPIPSQSPELFSLTTIFATDRLLP
eukprot:1196269-Prorocentrum_minimum.AAC.10